MSNRKHLFLAVVLASTLLLVGAAEVVTRGKRVREYPNVSTPGELDLYFLERADGLTNLNTSWRQTKMNLTNIINGLLLQARQTNTMGANDTFLVESDNHLWRITLSHAQTAIGTGGGGGSGVSNLSQLVDVTLTSLADGHLLHYDVATSKWINGTMNDYLNLYGLNYSGTFALNGLGNVYLINGSTFDLKSGAIAIWEPGSRLYMGTNAGIYAYNNPLMANQKWLFDHPSGTNNVARMGDIWRTPVRTLTAAAIMFVDCSVTNAEMQFCPTKNTGYNLTVVVTNVVPGKKVHFSIAGPDGSNYVTWVWEPWVRAAWPTDPFTDNPVTNNYIRGTNYLDVEIRPFATNNVRVAAAAFRL